VVSTHSKEAQTHLFPLCWYHSIVFSSPSFKVRRGSQPVSLRIFE
jgi:hypothetical protein